MAKVSRRAIIQGSAETAPVMAFTTYTHPTLPHLLQRTGWEIGDDVHDKFSDRTSQDNGASWSDSKPQAHCGVEAVDGGYIAHTENAVLYLGDSDTLIHITNDKFETDLAHCDLDGNCRVRITSGAPGDVAEANEASHVFISDYGKEQGLVVSFCNPIQDSRGRILAPVQWQMADAGGRLAAEGYAVRGDLSHVLRDYWESGLLIGERTSGHQFSWRLAGTVPFDSGTTSRGLCEGTLTELPHGRLAMVLRGSNAGHHEYTGCKWLSFSDDGGETWSMAKPLTYDDGSTVLSGSSGSALFRHQGSGELYWLGNPCLSGRAMANGPRTPLALFKVREEPFALVRESLRAIDQAPEDNPHVQLSNFKFYQDRIIGELVVYLTRYGERGADGKDWMDADMHEYRMAL